MTQASAVLTTRIPERLKRDLERLAENTHRAKSWLVTDALQNYVDLNRWQIEAIQIGLESAKAGRIVKHEDVEDWLDSWGTSEEKDPPK